jgi:hypothetical protein
MAYTVRKVDYFSMDAPNRPGTAVRLLSAMKDAKVNLLAFTGFPHGRHAQIDFIPENSAALKAAAKRAGIKLSARKTGFLVAGEDKLGAVLAVLSTLAQAKINVTAIDAVAAGKGRFGAILWVKPVHVTKAARALKARR